MSSVIKGITVEIGGDATPLNKALEGVNKNARSIESELKAVNKALQLDPTNTQLLAQKQKLLADSIANTKEKLSTLKEAERQAQEQFKQGKLNEEQYRALQREIATAEGKLKNLESQYTKLGNTASRALEGIAQKTKGIGEKLTGTGTAMLPITAGIAAGGALAVRSMDAVDEGLDTIAQKTGATGEAAQDLEAVYQEVSQTIPAAFGDIGAAVGELNTRLDFTGEKLRTASEDFLKFAKVNGSDVNTSVQLVTRAMGDAGIHADDYKQILDMLTVAGQKSGISIDTLATNLAKYGAPMRALGIDTETAIAMFAGWEKAGVNTETAFSGMKKAISNWGAAGKDSTVEFQKALDAIKAAPDIASATSMAIDIFGAKAGPDLADAIQGGRFEVEEYIEALQNAGGAVDTTYSRIVDKVDDTALASQTLQLALHDIGESISMLVGPMLLELAQKVKDVLDGFNGLDPSTQAGILAFAGIVAAIGPLLILLGQVAMGISAITGALAFLAANPIVLLIAGIVAAVAGLALGIKYLWDTNEGFRNALISAWDAIVAAIGTAIDGLIVFFTQTIPEAWATVTELFSNIGAWFAEIWQQVLDGATEGKTALASVWDGVVSTIGDAVNALVKFFTQTIPQGWATVTELFSNIGAWFAEIWQQILDGAAEGKAALASVWDGVVSTISDAVNTLVEFFTQTIPQGWAAVTELFSNIGAWFAEIWQQVLDGASAAWTTIQTTVTGIVDALVEQITSAWNICKEGVMTTLEGIKLLFSGAWEIIKNIVLGAVLIVIDLITGNFTALQSDLAGIWNNIKIGAITVWEGIGQYFFGIFETIKSIFSAAWETVKTAVVATCSDIKAKVVEIWDAVLLWVMQLPNKFYTIWESIKTGAMIAWEEIKQYFFELFETIKSLFSAAWDKTILIIVTACNNIKTMVIEIWSTILSWIMELPNKFYTIWENIKNGAMTAWEGIKRYFSGLFETIKSLFSTAWDKVKTTVITACNDIKTKVIEIFNAILTWLRELPGKLYTIGADLFRRMKDGVLSTIQAVVDAIKTGLSKAVDWIKDLPRQAVSWGADMIDGIARGIRSSAQNVINSVKDLAANIRAYLHFSVPDVGPLTDYETWMPDFMSGLARGIEENRYKVEQAMRALTYGIHTSFDIGGDAAGFPAAGAPSAEIGIYLDGSQIAAVVAPLVSQSIDAQATAAKRGRGIA